LPLASTLAARIIFSMLTGSAFMHPGTENAKNMLIIMIMIRSRTLFRFI